MGAASALPGLLSSLAPLLRWADLLQAAPRTAHRVIDTDLVAILYTSGSTGKPKGVVLSHRNMVAGAKSVASYLENRPGDTLLGAKLSTGNDEVMMTTGRVRRPSSRRISTSMSMPPMRGMFRSSSMNSG